MHPITFTKDHPVGVITSALAGMIIGPAVLNMISRLTGVTIQVPAFGGR